MEDEKKCEDAVSGIKKCHKYLEYGDNFNNIELYSCMSKQLNDYMKYCNVSKEQNKLE
jgi:hypothetical protein